MEFFGIGWMEMIVIGLVALIVVGPQRLPQAAQTIGRVVGYATQQWRNIQQQIREPVEREVTDIRGKLHEMERDITDLEPIGDDNARTRSDKP